jgi:hypothetical protein
LFPAQVVFDFLVSCQVAEGDQRRDAAPMRSAACGVQEAEAGEEVDAVATHGLQLANGIVVGSRFAENLAVEAGHLVAANDQRVGKKGAGDRAGLGFRKAQRACFGCFARQQVSSTAGFAVGEGQAKASQSSRRNGEVEARMSGGWASGVASAFRARRRQNVASGKNREMPVLPRAALTSKAENNIMRALMSRRVVIDSPGFWA